MTNFREVVDVKTDDILGDVTENPFAGRTHDGRWIPGYTRIEYLQSNFGHLDTATEMQSATDSEGLKMYFGWLADNGVIPRN